MILKQSVTNRIKRQLELYGKTTLKGLERIMALDGKELPEYLKHLSRLKILKEVQSKFTKIKKYDINIESKR